MKMSSLLARLPIGRFRNPPPTVAVLRLTGVIGGPGGLRPGLTLDSLGSQIERAFKLKHLKAVALAINSPGGSPVQSALIGRRIRALAEEKKVPVIAFAEDVAASGGYWLACAADEIFADENSIIGSIGVISAGFGFPALLERFGVERRVHTSGDRKAMLDPFRIENPDDVERLKHLQGEIHESFKSHVRDSRGERLKAGEDALFDGDIWTGRQAAELGLIDGLGEMRQVLRDRFGDKTRFKQIDGARPWWRRRLPLGGGAAWPGELVAALEERLLWARFGL